jgi:crossover junction endodeoxyribonuclease RuvC
MRILGIDPGSRAMGYGIVEVQKSVLVPIVHGILRPPTGLDLGSRLACLQEGLLKILEEFQPNAASVERAFVAMNPKTALVLGHARGVALASIAAHHIPLAEYSPTQVKAAVVGSGRAEKKEVQSMVQLLLKLDKLPGEDAADALAAAICHAHGSKLAGMRSGRSRGRHSGGSSGLVVRRMR